MRCSRLCFATLAVGLALALPALAQRQKPRPQVDPGRVTILTDGLSEPSSGGVQAVNELAERLGRAGIRVLPIAGSGAVANVRDLLLLRGVDLAILNSDVLAHLDMTGEFPDARRRIRLVTHLFDQKVYLLARKSLKSVGELRGRKIAVASTGAGRITAMTVFGLLKIDVDLQPISSGQLQGETALGGVDGVLLLGGEVTRLGISADNLEAFHLIPVPMTSALQNTYRPARIAEAELIGVARSAAGADSIAVSTVLAVFDWAPQQSRYENVANFVYGLFELVPKLREQPTSTIWRQADINASVPGWLRYGPANPRTVLSPLQLATLANVEKPVPQLATPALPSKVDSQAPKALSLLAINRAPLADETAQDGGLIIALLSKGLGLVGASAGKRPAPVVRWAASPSASLQALSNPGAADVLLPWLQADCERPNDLSQESALLCDRAVFSEPILQIVVGLFSLSEAGFKFETDESIHGRTVCVPLDRDLVDLNSAGRNWIAEKRVVVVRQPTLLDCIGLVQRRDADAFVASDLEGRHLLKRLGLGQLFAMAERPLGTRTVHAVVSKAHPQADEMIGNVNSAIRQLKESDAHATIVRQHLMTLWDARINVR